MPDVERVSDQLISSMTESLSIPRSFLPNVNQINWGLAGIYHTLSENLPPKEVDDLVVKMTVACSVGLFDGAIVYMWNKVIKTLRMKVKDFGPSMIKTVLARNDRSIENSLDSMTDANLIDLSYQLNIINDDGRMFLQQCREIRNEASIAHPTNIKIDENEMINFISRCCKYGLANIKSGQGIELQEVISTIDNENISDESINALAEKIKNSFELQQEFFIKILYHKYIDPSVNTFVQNNAINLLEKLKKIITPSLESDLITFHNQILVKGDDKNHSSEMSRRFFEKLDMVYLLNDYEKISMYNRAITDLTNIHYGYNNFYNEPPFAERLYDISKEINPIPETVISKYIHIVLDCYLGNSYGISENAEIFYEQMLKNLSPKTIEALLHECEDLKDINNDSIRKNQLAKLLGYYNVNKEQLTTKQKLKLNKLISKYGLV